MAKISNMQLAKYVVDQLEARAPVSAITQRLAGFLISERRTKDVSSILRGVEREFSERGNTRVTITSVHEVAESVKHQLAKMLQANNPVFETVIDPSIIGGVKAQAGELQLDLTVRSKINRFKQHVTM